MQVEFVTLKVASWQKFDAIQQCDNFGVDFKSLISVVLAIWEKIESVPYFEGNKKKKKFFLRESK